MHRLVRGLVALVAIFGAARAVATERTSVVVLPFPALFEEARASVGERISDSLQDEIGRSVRLGAARIPTDVEGTARAARAVATARRRFAEAQQVVAKNAAAWADPKNVAGGRALDQAIEQLEANLLGAETLAPLTNALAVKFRRQLASGAEAQARDTIRRALALAPDADFGLSGDAAKLQAEVRDELLSGPRGQVRVETTPPGATVSFDGRELGETPLVLLDVLPGEHRLRVQKAGLASVRSVQVPERAEVAARFELGALPSPDAAAVIRALRANTLDEAALKTARGIGRASGAQLVVVGAVEKVREGFRLHARVIRVSDGAIAALPAVDFDEVLLGLEPNVFTLASTIEKSLPEFSAPAHLPLELVEGAVAKAGDHAELVTVTPPVVAVAPAEESGGTHRSAGPVASALATEDALHDGAVEQGGSHVWLWTTLGVVAVAAAGTGAYFALHTPPAERVALVLNW